MAPALSANWKRHSLHDRIAIVLYWTIVLCCYIRIYYGVSPLDEAQHVGSAFLSSMGGRPFYNEMYLQQIAGLLYEPLAIVYYKIMGREGMYLFARHLFFFLTVLCSWIYYRCYRDTVSLPTTLAIATIPLFATVNGWPTINYHTLGSLGFAMSTLLSVRSVELQSNRLAVAAGIAFFVAVAGYPTLGATAVLTWVFIAAFRFYQRKPFLRQFLICGGTATVIMLAFAAYLYLRFNPQEILESYYFSKTFNTFGSFLNKILYSGWLFWGFAPSWYYFFPLLGVWIYLWIKKDIPIMAFGIVLLFLTMFKEPPENGTYTPTYYLLMAFVGILPILSRLRSSSEKNWSHVVLWLCGLSTAILICWSSGLTLYSTSMVTPYIFATLLAVSDGARKKVLQYLSALFVVIFMLMIHFKHIADDDHFFDLTERFESGPFAGLITSLDHYQFLTTLQADINECAIKGKSALYYDHYPAGFLMSDMYPATRSLFMHDISLSWFVRPMYTAHYSNPANRPDCVFRFTSISTRKGTSYDVDPKKFFPNEDVFWYYLPEKTGEYRLIRERATYNVYQKKNL